LSDCDATTGEAAASAARGANSSDGDAATRQVLPTAGCRGAALVRLLLAGSALLCVAYGTRGLVASYYASRPGAARIVGLERAARLVPENWTYDLELGQILAALGEHERAIARYREAIADYPACAVCWMSLAEAQAALGQDPSEAIEKAVTTGRSQPTTRLRAATLYAMLGRDEEAGREFAAAQHGVLERSDDLYATLHRLYNADFLVDHVFGGQDDLVSYFGFVLQHRPLADARVVWARVARDGVATPDWQRVAYSKMLLSSGQVHEAWGARFSHGPAADASLLDGSFEQLKDRKPFGWYVTPGEGVSAEVAACKDCPDGDRALHLAFDGKHNPRYGGVWQDVPVASGVRYVLRGKAKAEHITSASGPRVAVRGIGRADADAAATGATPRAAGGGQDCGLWVAGPEWKLASPWREFQIEFRVPDNCEGVRVLVNRQPTDQFNKFLGGELWIDELVLAAALH